MPLERDEHLALAIEAVQRAGQIVAGAGDRARQTQTKVGGESLASCVVTETDLQCQACILNVLEPTLGEVGLLTEESPDDHSRFEKDAFWCIDPLDGTLAFSRDQDGYSISVALVSRAGRCLIAAVYDPRAKNLYHASEAGGDFKNQRPLRLQDKGEGLTLTHDISHFDHPHYTKHLELIQQWAERHGYGELRYKPLGGAVMNAISTIEQAPAIYYKCPKSALGGGCLWDFAASSLIHREAGGTNSDFHGVPLNLNQQGSPFMNRRGVFYSSDGEIAADLRQQLAPFL